MKKKKMTKQERIEVIKRTIAESIKMIEFYENSIKELADKIIRVENEHE